MCITESTCSLVLDLLIVIAYRHSLRGHRSETTGSCCVTMGLIFFQIQVFWIQIFLCQISEIRTLSRYSIQYSVLIVLQQWSTECQFVPSPKSNSLSYYGSPVEYVGRWVQIIHCISSTGIHQFSRSMECMHRSTINWQNSFIFFDDDVARGQRRLTRLWSSRSRSIRPPSIVSERSNACPLDSSFRIGIAGNKATNAGENQWWWPYRDLYPNECFNSPHGPRWRRWYWHAG